MWPTTNVKNGKIYKDYTTIKSIKIIKISRNIEISKIIKINKNIIKYKTIYLCYEKWYVVTLEHEFRIEF